MLIACCKSLFPLWVVSHQFTKSAPLESECLEERIEILLGNGDDGRSDRDDGGESGLAVAEVHPGTGRSGGRASRNLIRGEARLLVVWRQCCRRQRPK